MITINSEEYGKIEIDREKREVYFYQGDLGYIIDGNDEFRDIWGREFKILWPIRSNWNDTVIEVKVWKEIGRSDK